jgi:hypothetical protein
MMISVPITLEQLITAVQQLQPQEFYTQPPIDDITDDDIMAEIKAVRQQDRQK